MRIPEYLSPTSIGTWLEDRDEFYLRYLTENRPPRGPQTQPMAVGSAFDAYVKAALFADLGLAPDPAYALEALFEAQVEPPRRDWARPNGLHVFDAYKALGAYDAILADLRLSETTPRFEFELRGEVSDGGRAVVLLGKPDLVYTRHGRFVVLDWKVNGYCGKGPTTPHPGYVNIRGGRSSGRPHPGCTPTAVNGLTINAGRGLESANPGWARQLSVYAWLLGAAVGSDFACGVDQLVAKPVPGARPEIRVAEHRYQVGPLFQHALHATAAGIYDAIAADHVFADMTRDEDRARRRALDQMAAAFDPASADDDYFLELTRR